MSMEDYKKEPMDEYEINLEGVLGELLLNKCSDVFLCRETGSTFKISHQSSRHENIGEIHFVIKTVDGIDIPCPVDD